MMRLLRFLPTKFWRPKAWKSWASYVHWRMETYGVYYPEGRFNKTAFRQMLRQLASYYRWLGEMDELKERPRPFGKPKHH